MSATENKRSIIVGIFIFIGLVIFIAGVLTLGGKQKRFVSSITLFAVFDNVNGIQAGNNVFFSGVKIGTVSKINFYGTSQVEVTMHIEKSAQKYIHKNSLAKLGSEGFIGNKMIEILGGPTQSPEVEDGDKLQIAQALGPEDIMKTLQANNENILAITNDFKSVSSSMLKGKGTLGTLLTDSVMADRLRQMSVNLENASATTARVTSAISQYTSKLNNKGTLATELLTDTTVFSNLKSAVKSLQLTAASASEMTNNLNKTSSKLNSDKNAIGVLLNDEETGARLKSTVSNLESSTKKLDENMEALQHNFLLRGFFKKKAKAEANAAKDAEKQ
ncbi:ABC transporter permease [Pedobacter antarcticus 4BY]|uniref:ABC transporter permease n=2 Tax=Pedobacter antarcticus TaxID=34086 RepID=A0A081PCL7_9SPHI|nr:MlaD family protein [Pedobacter antarcticus]KEQ28440.1 ABC transporter permease [Pedobacter antarcticus 4BY]SFF03981.1 phospholipid/cholesterol/gamma-HCH transport system substrate-binding protein [Pedobacter antarcticus]